MPPRRTVRPAAPGPQPEHLLLDRGAVLRRQPLPGASWSSPPSWEESPAAYPTWWWAVDRSPSCSPQDDGEILARSRCGQLCVEAPVPPHRTPLSEGPGSRNAAPSGPGAPSVALRIVARAARSGTRAVGAERPGQRQGPQVEMARARTNPARSADPGCPCRPPRRSPPVADRPRRRTHPRPAATRSATDSKSSNRRSPPLTGRRCPAGRTTSGRYAPGVVRRPQTAHAREPGIPDRSGGFAQVRTWGRRESNPHWHGPKPCASANWATAPRRTLTRPAPPL